MKKEEHYLQCNIVKLLRMKGILVFSIPNGSLRHLYVAKQLKAEGVLAGCSDLIIVLQNKVVFVELKTNKGKQQESQKIFQKRVEELGHQYLIWRSLDDAIEFINKL